MAKATMYSQKDKAVAVLVDSGVFGHKDSCGAKAFRKAMEE